MYGIPSREALHVFNGKEKSYVKSIPQLNYKRLASMSEETEVEEPAEDAEDD